MRALLPILLLAALSVPAAAQQPVALLPIGTPQESHATGATLDDPEQLLFVGIHVDGLQRVIDVSNPAAPTLLSTTDPRFGDTWGPPLFSDGSLYTGHRNGGVVRLDASQAAQGSDLPELASTSTSYHFKGLCAVEDSAGRYLLYSEHEAGGQPGGLLVLDAETLQRVGNGLSTDSDGQDLVALSSGEWAYQHDAGYRPGNPGHLANTIQTWDLRNKANPVLGPRIDLGNTPAHRNWVWGLALDERETHLYSCAGADGFHVVDVTNPAQPVHALTRVVLGHQVRLVTNFRNQHLVVNVRDMHSLQEKLALVDVRDPIQPEVVVTAASALTSITGMVAQQQAPHSLFVVGHKGNVPYLEVWQ